MKTELERLQAKEYYALHRREISDKRRAQRQQDPERFRNYVRKSLHKIPEAHRKSYMKHRHRSDLSTRAKVIASRYAKLAPHCEKCPCAMGLERHHDDYLKPLEVRTLCKIHHEEWHVYNKALHQYDDPHLLDNRHCDSCIKSYPECGRGAPAFRGHTCALWYPKDGNWIRVSIEKLMENQK